MLFRVLLGSLLSAVVLFFWGWIYWHFVPPLSGAWRAIPVEIEERLVQDLDESLSVNGVYMYPRSDTSRPDQNAAHEEWIKKNQTGPRFMIFFNTQGFAQRDMSKTLIAGFVHMLVCSLFCGGLLASAGPMCCYPARVFFVFMVGLFATVWINFSNPIWFHHPWDNALLFAGYNTVAWLLAGLVLGAIVSKRKAADNVETTG